MIDLSQIKNSYSSDLHKFERGMLREYLQYQILAIIFTHPLARKLSFLGGTCLRIVHGLPRFSEDIDFDNKKLSEAEFTILGRYLEKELTKVGFLVEIRFVSKGAFHCYIKFPELLFEQGLSPQKSEKILIQIDTFDQGSEYESEIFILNKFEFFTQVRTTPKNIILSQKLWTITQRPRLKGRDFFDIMFLFQNTLPDLGFLQAKFGKKPLSEILAEILEKLEGTDYKAVAEDVRPFLVKDGDVAKIKLFPEFIKQVMVRNS